MRWSLVFEYDGEAGTLTIAYDDGLGERVEDVFLGDDLPHAKLYSRTNSETGIYEGVRFVVPEWQRVSPVLTLVRVLNLMGPA